jgi:hypothetical protein
VTRFVLRNANVDVTAKGALQPAMCNVSATREVRRASSQDAAQALVLETHRCSEITATGRVASRSCERRSSAENDFAEALLL